MNKKQKLLISIPIIIIVGLLGTLIYLGQTTKTDAGYGYTTVEENNTDKTETKADDDSKEKNAVKEKTLEEKEKEIESKKPKNKIVVDLLKDTSNATVDDTLATLPNAPLHYTVDGVKVKLKENSEKQNKFTKELTAEDIKRLQSYGYYWHTGFVDKVPPRYKYGEYYKKYPEDAKWVKETMYPQRIDVFKNAIIGWITNPNLAYETCRGYYGISGVLQLSYLREDNIFNLEPYKGYERDVEFRYANTTDGLFLRQIIYLSDWREIEEWRNPYE